MRFLYLSQCPAIKAKTGLQKCVLKVWIYTKTQTKNYMSSLAGNINMDGAFAYMVNIKTKFSCAGLFSIIIVNVYPIN